MLPHYHSIRSSYQLPCHCIALCGDTNSRSSLVSWTILHLPYKAMFLCESNSLITQDPLNFQLNFESCGHNMNQFFQLDIRSSPNQIEWNCMAPGHNYLLHNLSNGFVGPQMIVFHMSSFLLALGVIFRNNASKKIEPLTFKLKPGIISR